MKCIFKKIGRFLAWSLLILFAIYLTAKLADFGWYRTRIPVGFHDANWIGKWNTEQYLGVEGRLLVRLPDPLPENADFKAEALVYYPIYCPWQTGKFVKMDFVGHFSPDAPTATGTSTNRIPGGGQLKFKAVIDDQVVEYIAIVDQARTRIAGGYLSQSPDDIGLFWIECNWLA